MRFFALLLIPLWMSASNLKDKIDQIIVIYLENRSFDNLFYGYKGADTSDEPLQSYPLQINGEGKTYSHIEMGPNAIQSGFPKQINNTPFLLDEFIPQEGMIPDMVHRFYQSILQIDNGKNDRFAYISNEKALVMGYHNMHESHMWRYAKEFTLCDRFFAAAYGGSFLNHQWLIAAQTPYVGKESNISRYELDENGEILKDGILTPDGYAVNTIQPFYPPFKAKYFDSALRLKPLMHDTIGDRLSERNISWGWYSGGYRKALEGKGDEIHYQYHHNPFLYFERYKPGSEGRRHLHDEEELIKQIKNSSLPNVVFFKPSAEDNQHPGYASVKAADEKLYQIVELIRSNKPLWEKSLILVTYDENGGLWDHVAPPAADRWGPGTRVPALVISPYAKKGYVDHTPYDTTSILRFIEWRHNLKLVGERQSANMLNALEE